MITGLIVLAVFVSAFIVAWGFINGVIAVWEGRKNGSRLSADSTS